MEASAPANTQLRQPPVQSLQQNTSFAPFLSIEYKRRGDKYDFRGGVVNRFSEHKVEEMAKQLYLTRNVATSFTVSLLWHFRCRGNSEVLSGLYDVEDCPRPEKE